MNHTVKGFLVVSEAEVDVFLEFPCFLYDPVNIGNLMSIFWAPKSLQMVTTAMKLEDTSILERKL